MRKLVSKSKAEGRIFAPASKSMAHRLLISAAMCKGQTSVIRGIDPCEDVLATIDCLREFGVKIEYKRRRATVVGIDFTEASPHAPLNCRESGSTLRFLIPLAMLSGNEVKFVGSERLLHRSQSVYEQIAKEYGLRFEKSKDGITVQGPLSAGEYFIDGDVSSQFISGLMLGLSALSGDSRIVINTKIESEPYVKMTIDAMANFGVRVYRENAASFFLFGGQEYRAREIRVEGDWSNAAYIDALNYLGGEVKISGLKKRSLQGDRVYPELLSALCRGYAEIDITDCPDLAPLLFAIAAAKHGGKFIGTRRLRDKESDRIEAMKSELEKFGAELKVEENAVTVLKRDLHAPKKPLCGHNDHRIVMALTLLCTLFSGEIDGCEAVSKSYPDYWRDISRLGIAVTDT